MAIVTLVSGGVDSTLMSLMAHEEGSILHPLFVDYGQLAAAKEWATCQLLHEKLGLPKVTRMEVSGFGRTIPSGITDAKLRINEDAFLPGRNLLLILAGAAYAYRTQSDSVAVGLLHPEGHLFPDQTREFLKQCQVVVEMALGKRIRILTPLSEFSKKDVLVMAAARRLHGTYSCHSGEETPCGKCVSCMEIANAVRGN